MEFYDDLREVHRQHEDLHRAEKRLTLQIKAICRRLCWPLFKNLEKKEALAKTRAEGTRLYDSLKNGKEHSLYDAAVLVCAPLMQAFETVHKARLPIKRDMEKFAERIPIYDVVNEVRGLGAIGLAQLVGEAGSFINYPNPAKLWKRMGLAVVHGERQQKKKGKLALDHAYSPSRRSIVWNIGVGLIASGDNPYRTLYEEKKAEYTERFGKETAGANGNEPLTPKHIHNRAKRYMEKRLLRDLWARWHRIVEQAPLGN